MVHRRAYVSAAALAVVSAAGACVVGVACSSFHGDAPPAVDAAATPDVVVAEPPDAEPPPDTPTGATRHVYVFGGARTGDDESAHEAFRAPILADGGLGAWERVPALDIDDDLAALAVVDGKVVLAGGHRPSTPDATATVDYLPNVDIASLDPPAPWTAASPLPMPRGTGAVAVSGSHLYFTGGGPAVFSPADDVWTTTVDQAAVAPWTSAGTLPVPLDSHTAAVMGSRLYVVGGATHPDGGYYAFSPDSYTATIAEDGSLGAFTKTGALASPAALHAMVSTGLVLYVLGGLGDALGDATTTVQIGKMAESGDLAWSRDAPLLDALYASCAVLADDVIYVLGGSTANKAPPVATVQIGRIGMNGGIAWTHGADMPMPRTAFGCAVR